MKRKDYRILIIEDDRLISEMYTRSLRKVGYTVDEVINGPDGVERGKNGSYQLILLDIMIPILSGIDVLNSLRGKDGVEAGVRIIIMTNFDQDDETREELEGKADGYLIKADITPTELVEIVNNFRKQDYGEKDADNLTTTAVQ